MGFASCAGEFLELDGDTVGLLRLHEGNRQLLSRTLPCMQIVRDLIHVDRNFQLNHEIVKYVGPR